MLFETYEKERNVSFKTKFNSYLSACYFQLEIKALAAHPIFPELKAILRAWYFDLQYTKTQRFLICVKFCREIPLFLINL